MKRNRFLPIVLTSNWTSEHTVDSDGSKEENSKADNGKTSPIQINGTFYYMARKSLESKPSFMTLTSHGKRMEGMK